MNNTVRLIGAYTKNGVVPLSLLKKRNYPIFKYFLSNYRVVLKQLKDNGIYVLNDLSTLNNIVKIKYYLLYHYGETVNMSLLRQADYTIYWYLSNRGEPGALVEELGFEITYAKKSSDKYILDELYRIADKNKDIFQLNDSSLYGKLYYRARKKDITLKEYIKSLGFTYIDRDFEPSKVVDLKEQGKSFSEIGKELNVPKSTIYRLYLQEVNKDLGGK